MLARTLAGWESDHTTAHGRQHLDYCGLWLYPFQESHFEHRQLRHAALRLASLAREIGQVGLWLKLLHAARFIVTRNRDCETSHRRNFVSHGPARVR